MGDADACCCSNEAATSQRRLCLPGHAFVCKQGLRPVDSNRRHGKNATTALSQREWRYNQTLLYPCAVSITHKTSTTCCMPSLPHLHAVRMLGQPAARAVEQLAAAAKTYDLKCSVSVSTAYGCGSRIRPCCGALDTAVAAITKLDPILGLGRDAFLGLTEIEKLQRNFADNVEATHADAALRPLLRLRRREMRSRSCHLRSSSGAPLHGDGAALLRLLDDDMKWLLANQFGTDASVAVTIFSRHAAGAWLPRPLLADAHCVRRTCEVSPPRATDGASHILGRNTTSEVVVCFDLIDYQVPAVSGRKNMPGNAEPTNVLRLFRALEVLLAV